MTLEERNDMIIQNMNLVYHLAHKMYLSPYAYYSYEDIAQEGMVGLIKAVDNFDPKLGFAFSTYASAMIRGSMLRFIRENQHSMRYSRKDIDAFAKIQRSGKHVSDITQEDLKELDISDSSFSAVISMVSATSLDSEYIIGSDDSAPLRDMIPMRSDEFSEEFYEANLEGIKNSVINKHFPAEKSKDIIDEWYYSMIIGMKPKQSYLARKYSCSQPKITRLISSFKQKFRKALEEEGYYG